MGEYESTVEKVTCQDCGHMNKAKKITTFLANLKIAWLQNYQKLEEEINRFFQDQIHNCYNCHKRTGLYTHSMGPYLWIDTDEVYRKSTYAQDELKILLRY